MVTCAAVALVVSLLAILAGGVLREIAVLPWLGLAVAAAGDIALSWQRRRALDTEMAEEVFVGETTRLSLALPVHQDGLSARLIWPEGLSGPREISFGQAAGGGAIAMADVRAVRRGVWKFSDLWLRWQSKLGLFEFVPRLAFAHEVRVIPNIRPIQSGAITTKVQSTLFGVKENRAIGDGSEFHQLREFVQGMDVKSIDWKRSARRRSLVSKDVRAERNHHVIIALDNGYLMREEIAGLPKIDHAVNAALATAWAANIGGDLVGYFSYDVRPRTFSAPQPGRTAFARMRRWTAELEYVSRETNHTLALTELNARTPKRSLIVVFTDFIDTTSAELLVENIGILAKRHAMIFVAIRDPDLETLVSRPPDDLDAAARIVAANQSLSERRLVLERLNRMGVTVVDALPNAVTAQVISAYLTIKAREMVA